MACKCWQGFYEKDNDVFIEKTEYLKLLESDNPAVKEIAQYALEVMSQNRT